MKFVVDLLKLLVVILPLVGKMLESNYKKKHVNEEDISKEDNALFEEEEANNTSNFNDSTSDNSNLSHPTL